jgi:hypothetical protein
VGEDDVRSRFRVRWCVDLATAQGNLPSARQFYETAVAIAEPIAKADPGNARWQRDLAVSRNMIGNVLFEQGNLPAALKSDKMLEFTSL